MRGNSALERLRAANPVPSRTAAALRPDPALFRAIVSGRVATGQRDARPPAGPARLRVALLVLALSGLIGGTVAYALSRGGVSKPQTVGCYEAADLEARTAVVGVGPAGPVATCAEVWRRGDLGSGGEVPALMECALGSGAVGVFPADPRLGGDVCGRLATPPPGGGASTTPSSAPPPTLAEANDRFFVFRDAVLPVFVESPCVDPALANELVRRELDRAGLGDWRIRSGDFSADRPCATLSFRTENREIVLTPSPPRR